MKPLGARLMWISLALIGMVCLTVIPARATSINISTYDVEGQLSFVGNPVCTPSPCTQTLDLSFLMTVSDKAGFYLANVVPDSMHVTSLGPLGDFAWNGRIQNIGTQNIMSFGGPNVVIDLRFSPNAVPFNFVPVFTFTEIWFCGGDLYPGLSAT